MSANQELSLRDHAWEIALSWLWFFLILLSYYCLKPLRDGLVSSLAGNLGNLYLATFLTSIVALSLYSRLVATVPRSWLLILVYQFFTVCLIAFGVVFASSESPSATLVSVFFVWVSVFNLFIVTLFWSVMADKFTGAQAKAWFGIIAAAGSVGSISGSAIAFQLSRWVGTQGLLISAIVALELAIVVGLILLKTRKPAHQREASESQPTQAGGTGGSIFAGFTHVVRSPYLIGICLFVALGKFSATFVYNNLQWVLGQEMPDEVQRTTLFSEMNLYAQSGSLLTQALVAGWIMKRLGLAVAMLIPCLLMFILFVWLSFDAALTVLVIGQVGQQIAGYGLMVPAQHVLFTVLSREDKYKSKGFTDIVVFRGSDVAAGKACDAMIRSGTALSLLATLMLPLVAVWGFIAIRTGRTYRVLALERKLTSED